jgi:uncharacterized protein YndB with AHSA1/START domain
MPSSFTLTTPSDREIAMTRRFDFPRRLVFETLVRPELLKQWLLGPPGWSMPVCEIDLRVGGTYRYVWRNDSDGHEMGMGGVFREIVPPERVVATEVWDQPWYPGEAVVTYTLVEEAGATALTLTVMYQSKEARDSVLQSNMESGVGTSFDRLEQVLAATPIG